MQDLKYWLWLSKIGINEKLKKDLILKYKNPRLIYELTKIELKKENIDNLNIAKILKREDRRNLEEYEKYIKKNDIGVLSIFFEEYPDKLLHIYDSPTILFYKGNIKLLKKRSIAIIGSRECSQYGIRNSKYFAECIASNDICVISGLAKGIDAYAHIGSVTKKGKTVAIIGSGLDIIYPKENLKLANDIINNGGLLLSEYIIGTKPLAMNFPKRNRIISALSDGVLVVEATKDSGALITADFALEQGKEIYAIPGNITSYNSYGTNELIKQGAKLVTNAKDILDDFIRD